MKSVLETRVFSPSRERVPHFAEVVLRLSEMCHRADGACLPLRGETLPVIFSSRNTLKRIIAGVLFFLKRTSVQ